MTANATGQRILMTNCEGRIFFFKNFSQQEEQFERQIEDNLSSLNVSSAGDKTPWFSQNSFPTHYQRNIDLTTVFNETLTGVFYENLMSHNFKKRLFWKNCALTTYATGQRILMTNCEGGIFFFFFSKNLLSGKNNLKDKCIENLSSLNVSSAGGKTPWFSQNSFPGSLSWRFIIQSNISTTANFFCPQEGRWGDVRLYYESPT